MEILQKWMGLISSIKGIACKSLGRKILGRMEYAQVRTGKEIGLQLIPGRPSSSERGVDRGLDQTIFGQEPEQTQQKGARRMQYQTGTQIGRILTKQSLRRPLCGTCFWVFLLHQGI
ncbi:hypothetical protein [Pasteuria penetrans]|uniref:hypothetical protein n=1 Tax=Pasteuria penetrans TaxID=86005 RepID=UPI0011ECF9BE|nr:hypothetical protein [Pasteuria penetrans]